MGGTTTAGAAPPTWHESIRELFQTAWDALDRTQIVLYHQYEDTRDERIGRFKERFADASSVLIDLALDELYPPEEDTPHATGNDSDEAAYLALWPTLIRERLGAGSQDHGHYPTRRTRCRPHRSTIGAPDPC